MRDGNTFSVRAALACIFLISTFVFAHPEFPARAMIVVPPTSAFRGVDPVRILDTRGGLRPTSNSSTVLDIAGNFGVPSDATSVVLNVTAYEPDREGYVTVYPRGTSIPNTSNVNMQGNRDIVPNLVTAKVGEAGDILLYSSVGTHLIVDLFGYYVPTVTSRAGRFVPADSPLRVLDTRKTISVPVDGRVNVPIPAGVPFASQGVEGLVFNVTAVNSKVRQNGFAYWTAVPSGENLPDTSNLNIQRFGQTIANQVIVAANADGVDFYSYAGGDLIVDYLGYYTGEGAPEDDDGLFVAVSPTRLLDTRSSPNPLGDQVAVHHEWSVEVATSGFAGVPADGARAVALNVTMTRALDQGFVTVHPAGRVRPDASNINADRAGTTAPNHVQVRSGTRGVTLYSFGGTDLIVDLFGWFVGNPIASALPTPQNVIPAPQRFPGQITVPSIKLSSVVREGVEFVDFDPSHLIESRTPNQPGNVAIFGHRTSKGKEFRNLDQMKAGALIYLTLENKIYTYSTTSVEILLPTDPSLYASNTNEQTLTLVACHPPHKITQRIVVRAVLVSVVSL